MSDCLQKKASKLDRRSLTPAPGGDSVSHCLLQKGLHTGQSRAICSENSKNLREPRAQQGGEEEEREEGDNQLGALIPQATQPARGTTPKQKKQKSHRSTPPSILPTQHTTAGTQCRLSCRNGRCWEQAVHAPQCHLLLPGQFSLRRLVWSPEPQTVRGAVCGDVGAGVLCQLCNWWWQAYGAGQQLQLALALRGRAGRAPTTRQQFAVAWPARHRRRAAIHMLA